MPAPAAATPCPRDAPRADGYARRRPERTLLYQVIQEHWPAFRKRAQENGGLPGFVERELEEYLACGIVERGLVHLECRRCGESIVAGFSCKRRGFCPSCLGRRMADLAAHLVDEVLPEAPVRHWICSLPWRCRYPLAFDRRLCADVLGAFVGALRRSLRARAKNLLGLRSGAQARTGAITFVQRSDSSLRVNPHFHTIALDGVFVRDGAGKLAFHDFGEPSAEEVAQVAAWTYEGLARAFARQGRSLDGADDLPDSFSSEEPLLASLYAASAADIDLFGARPGQKAAKIVQPVRLADEPSPAAAEVGGVNVHAKVRINGHDRERIERLCRYVARPPLAQDRLELYGDGRLRYRFKAPWKDGTSAVLLHPLDFIGRLCAIVPPPRFHMLRYHGLLAANAADRAEVVPGRTESHGPSSQLPLFPTTDPSPPPPARHPWAWLLRRVFAVDILVCPRCAGRMRVLEVATREPDIARILAGLGLAPRPPPRPPPTARGQLSLALA